MINDKRGCIVNGTNVSSVIVDVVFKDCPLKLCLLFSINYTLELNYFIILDYIKL